MGKVKKSVEADASASSSKYDPEANSKAIMIRHIPYGFFEKELKSYFSQFGNIRRVRLPRNRKVLHFHEIF
ncbi:unnamed protein product [Gongylonema pulchrum]|uniref:RRM domain-containing protein n=1 Tax=Gongylonema pulchrum TaxID=637853 RepID=A0A183D8W0_9BILA|nr:unnamed protein product [Gongylonema pulchrum]